MARHRSLSVLALSLTFALTARPSFAQFGNPLKGGNNGNNSGAVSLTRDLPPAVNLENTRIKLDVNAAGKMPPQSAQTLQTKLTTSIQGDKRFILDPQNPTTLVSLTVLKSGVTRNNVNATVSNKQVQITRVAGNIQMGFQVIDAVSKKPMDSTTLEAVFDRSYLIPQTPKLGGLGGLVSNAVTPVIPNDAQVMEQLTTDITQRVTRRIASTKEVIPLSLPDGDLKSQQDKVKNKQWVALYDELDVMKPPNSPEGQAQRQYWMGVSKEAQAYETQNRDDARKSLLTSVRHYQEAAKIQVDKPEYGESARRAEESVVLLAGPTPDGTAGAPATLVSSNGNSKGVSSNSDTMTNDHVIQLVKSGMDAALLVEIVNDAKSPNFDVSPNGLVRLSQEKVPTTVIQAMRKRAGGQ
jgi:hypothetical protein